MSAFGFYEKDEVVEAIKILAAREHAVGKSPRKVIESIMEAVTYGLDLALYDLREERVEGNWKNGVPEYIDGALFDVILNDGQERKCKRITTLDPCSLFFTDCTHPNQNALCCASTVLKWRVSVKELAK